MAVSPTVNAYMQDEQQQGPQSADQLFTQQFTSMAQNTMQAKYPQLINHLVTFKVLSSDVDAGTAFGVFIFQKGKDVTYVPVTMVDGAITSCEMAYDKGADQFYSLVDENVKEIVDANRFADPRILTKNPHVEDTRALFHNMVRPPQSSNVVLAGERSGIDKLPNEHKAELSRYLTEENPQLLAKIATFYDVEHLAHKLAETPQTEKTAAEAPLPSFLRLESLTREVAAQLTKEAREDMLRDGYVIKCAEDSPVHVFKDNDLSRGLTDELHLEVYTAPDAVPYIRQDSRVLTGACAHGDVVRFGGTSLVFSPAIFCEDVVLLKDSGHKLNSGSSVVVSNLRQGEVTREQLLAHHGVFTITDIRTKCNSAEKDTYARLLVFVPTRHGGWNYTLFNSGMCIKNLLICEQGETLSIFEDSFVDRYSLHAVPWLEFGSVKNKDSVYVPKTALCCFVYDFTDLPGIGTLEGFLRMARVPGVNLRVADNGAGISITNRTTEKTASFPNKTEAAAWLHGTWGMSSGQVGVVLSSDSSWVFEKRAFDASNGAVAAGQQMAEIDGTQANVQGATEYPAEQMTFDPSALEDFAEIEDPEVMDAGILASYANDPDVKSVLVEYLPDFQAAQDRIGRILLLFSSQKQEFEDFFGTEKYTSLVASFRKAFTVLGTTTASLKSYINMV